ncbi:asparaginase [Hydrogenispora ethanolica]|uniref:asparaginase n=1 Tax=Hydrogenispora ethanolica TaxID=1082276 RepID=A0A4R1S715_HYDET|nr:asparaginase [Hydrogenispora ethanolica]TCL75136.1 asparaginase [Hydrogenispora ethanolica]
MKRVLCIGTGGTIASSDGADGLTPVYSPDILLEFIPEVQRICEVDSLPIMNIDSTNMQPRHWLAIAEAVRRNYAAYDGFVITHGTDTLAYTAAMLSYLLQNSRKPVVITGSQKPMAASKTDGPTNLRDAVRYACDGRAGVYIVFNGQVINGCRAVKIRTRSYNAFESVNYPAVASIYGAEIAYNPYYSWPPAEAGERFYDAIAPEVMLVKLMPGVTPDIFDFIKGKYRGVVIESYGSGGIPFLGAGNLLVKVNELVAAGVVVVITTQCLLEGGNLNLYEVGRKLLQSRVIPAYDMTTEAAVTKLMWALGQASGFAAVRELFLTPIANDLSLPGPEAAPEPENRYLPGMKEMLTGEC